MGTQACYITITSHHKYFGYSVYAKRNGFITKYIGGAVQQL